MYQTISMMELLNKIIFFIFGIELTLNIAYVYLTNRASLWLGQRILNQSGTQENFNLYISLANFTFAVYLVIFLGLYIFALSKMRQRDIWFANEMNFNFKNRLLLAKLIGIIFIARYFIFMINDFAQISTAISGSTSYSDYLTSQYLVTGVYFSPVDNQSLRTPFSILLNFLSDMINAFVYALFHFLIIVFIEFTSDKVYVDQEKLYPVNS